MTKRLTLPLKTAATYNPRTDTVVITSDDPVLGKNRFRVNLRRNTVEDRTLRQLILSEENLASLEKPTKATPPPRTSTLPKGHLPIGVSSEGQQIAWNPDRDPHLLIVAKEYRARARATSMLLAAARRREDDWEVIELNGYGETLQDIQEARIPGRAHALRREGATWYQELAEPPKKSLLFLDAAETLSEGDAVAMRRILLLGPSLGIQVVAVVADRPDWSGKAMGLFEARLVVGEPAKTRGEFSDSHQGVIWGNHEEFKTAPPLGENAAIFGRAQGSYHQVRFHSMPVLRK